MVRYIHLNTSFSNHLGLLDGKSGAVLYFATLSDPHYRNDISCSFLEEILEQLHVDIPATYGAGLSGIGSLLYFLHKRGIIEDDPEELLEEAEPFLIEQCVNSKIRGISLSSGISGLGFYFLMRVKNNLSYEKDKLPLYQNCISASLSQIRNQVATLTDLTLTPQMLTIWHGLPGVYLFLLEVERTELFGSSVRSLIKTVEDIIVKSLLLNQNSWETLEAYFVLLSGGSNWRFQPQFEQFIKKISSNPICFYKAAWYALLVKITAEQRQVIHLIEFSKNIEKFVNETILCKGLKDLFPFDIEKGCVPMGLDGGVCGTALPLISLKTGEYGWLSLFGVFLKNNHEKNK